MASTINKSPYLGSSPGGKFVLETQNLRVYYRDFLAIKNLSLQIERRQITAIVGPSGCGKSTTLRAFNRMNELLPSTRTEGKVLFHGKNIYAQKVEPLEVRRRIGMIFQRPAPFAKSIYENVAFGLRVNGFQDDMDTRVEQSLRQAALWNEVKDRLLQSALTLSDGQQQRLCLARAIAIRPEVILMDEPTSKLDPVAALQIEELMRQLAHHYTVVLATPNTQQAARVSDYMAFFALDENRAGCLIEHGPTRELFINPRDKRTEAYITGRFR